jgi:hypothetical protein
MANGDGDDSPFENTVERDDIDERADDADVVERTEVREMPEDEVNNEVDRMLQGDDPSGDHSDALVNDSPTDGDSTTSTSDSTQQAHVADKSDDPLADADPSNIDPADLEDQEWTLGDSKEDKIIEFKEMKFLLSEPDDDELLDIIGSQPGEEMSPSDNMRELCQATIQSPTLSDARWSDLNIAERLGLMMRVSDFVGLDEFMDFQDVGAEAPQGM